MYFILSKLFGFLFYPSLWVLVLFLLSFIVRRSKLKRRLLIAAIVLLYIFSNSFLLNSFARYWDVRPQPLNQQKYSSVIVLGGFAGEDVNGNGRFNWAADRFIQGLTLFHTGKVSHILISSGNASLMPDGFREADWVTKQLQLLQVPDSCILNENRSRNTIENAAYSKVVLQQHHLQPPYLLVTSAFHMRRAAGIFKNAGVDFVPYPCNYIAGGKPSIGDLIPDAEALFKWTFYIREVVGVSVNSITGH